MSMMLCVEVRQVGILSLKLAGTVASGIFDKSRQPLHFGSFTRSVTWSVVRLPCVREGQ